jgi:hypothetical protein
LLPGREDRAGALLAIALARIRERFRQLEARFAATFPPSLSVPLSLAKQIAGSTAAKLAEALKAGNSIRRQPRPISS